MTTVGCDTEKIRTPRAVCGGCPVKKPGQEVEESRVCDREISPGGVCLVQNGKSFIGFWEERS